MVKFTKAVATGNDFIVVDNRSAVIKGRLSSFAGTICDRKRSVGADGLLLLERSAKADFRMRIFNCDGSEAQMCGNGSRCIALYAHTKKVTGADMKIETLAGILTAHVKGPLVKVKLTDPKDIKLNFSISIQQGSYCVNFVNTGVPHVIHFVDDLNAIDVKNLGARIRYHKEFSPHGANADFVQVMDRHAIKIRTYERGVEDETLACGTGAVASAIMSAEAEGMRSPVTVHTRGGENLRIYFDMVDSSFRNVYLEGKAALVFDGTMKR